MQSNFTHRSFKSAFQATVQHETSCRIPKRVPTPAERILNWCSVSCWTEFQPVAAERVTHQRSRFSLCPAERSGSEADIKAQLRQPRPAGALTSDLSPYTARPRPAAVEPLIARSIAKATRGLCSGTGTHQERDGDPLGAAPALR